jgi:hypothetical protein
VAGKADRNQPSARSGRRIAQVIYLVLAAAFIGSATWQVERQVFAGGPVGDSATDRSCSFALVAFEEQVTNGMALGSQMHTLGKALEEFEDKTSAPLASVEKRCEGRDLAAVATARRMREVAEAALRNQQTVLAPFRAEVKTLANP